MQSLKNVIPLQEDMFDLQLFHSSHIHVFITGPFQVFIQKMLIFVALLSHKVIH